MSRGGGRGTGAERVDGGGSGTEPEGADQRGGVREAGAVGSSRTQVRIRAPREAVYGAFLSPEALAAWLAPEGMTGQVHAFDGREGGGYRMSLFYPPGEGAPGKTAEFEDRFTSRFVELRPPERIVQVVTFDSEDPAFAGEMRMEVTLEEEAGGGAGVTVAFEGIPPGIRPEDNDAGTRSSLEKLARLLDGVDDGDGPVIRRIRRQPTLSIRAEVAWSDAPAFFDRAYGALLRHLGSHGGVLDGPPLSCSHRRTADGMDVEAALPLLRAVDGAGEIVAGEIPPVEVATTFHVGSYAGLSESYRTLADFVAREGRRATGVAFDFYVDDPGRVPVDRLRTRIALVLEEEDQDALV